MISCLSADIQENMLCVIRSTWIVDCHQNDLNNQMKQQSVNDAEQKNDDDDDDVIECL